MALLVLAYTIFVLSLSIVFHEMGHFISGILCGAIVQEFSIGFGKILFSFKIRGIRFSLRWIPVGGFVKILGESADEENQDDPRLFTNLAWWKRLIVLIRSLSASGFAFLILFLLYRFGGVVPDTPIIVTSVEKGRPAEESGILPNDIILSMDNVQITSSTDLFQYLQKVEDKDVTLQIQRGENILQVKTQARLEPYQGLPSTSPKYQARLPNCTLLAPIVGSVTPDTPAHRSGIMPLDKIVSIESIPVFSFLDVEQILADFKDRSSVSFELLRGDNGGERIYVDMAIETIPIQDQVIVNSGLMPLTIKGRNLSSVRSAGASVSEILMVIYLNVDFFKSLIQGQDRYYRRLSGVLFRLFAFV